MILRSLWPVHDGLVPTPLILIGNPKEVRRHWVSPARKLIPYQRLYRFGYRFDIFQISVNTGVPFRVYHYFIYLIYVYTHTPTQTHPHRQINTEIHKHTQCFCNWAKFCHILFNNNKIIYKKIIIAHTVLHITVH